jgi:hypothetical protein
MSVGAHAGWRAASVSFRSEDQEVDDDVDGRRRTPGADTNEAHVTIAPSDSTCAAGAAPETVSGARERDRDALGTIEV